ALSWNGRARLLKTGGDPAWPDGEGAIREIRVAWLRFRERIRTHQPHWLIEYEILNSRLMRKHQARIELASVPGGTQLSYQIEFESALPLLGSVICGVLSAAWRRGLRRSVEDIVRQRVSSRPPQRANG
ncbi:MAG: SRPBCC family protein, partial [Panacagrimonas sp.]